MESCSTSLIQFFYLDSLFVFVLFCMPLCSLCLCSPIGPTVARSSAVSMLYAAVSGGDAIEGLHSVHAGGGAESRHRYNLCSHSAISDVSSVCTQPALQSHWRRVTLCSANLCRMPSTALLREWLEIVQLCKEHLGPWVHGVSEAAPTETSEFDLKQTQISQYQANSLIDLTLLTFAPLSIT